MVFFGFKDAKENTAAAGSKHREEEEEERDGLLGLYAGARHGKAAKICLLELNVLEIFSHFANF